MKRKVRKAKKRRIKSEAAATKKTVDGAANAVKQISPSEATHMEKSSKKVEPDDNNKTGMLTQYILCLVMESEHYIHWPKEHTKISQDYFEWSRARLLRLFSFLTPILFIASVS